ncbi:transposase [Marinobacter bohaiensis]|uniref:transposase n=1 Tax=Marinobacter bohaiensis TaxID=2201898 RepID=UPI000DAF25D8|nr:transposase [Marinobacter bohaiensis]
MARPLRLEFAGALYHVTSRGNRREMVYESDDDRRAWLSILDEVCEIFNWVCHAYCLMGNHYHLLIETPEGNLSKGMRQLNGVYTQVFNRHHGRVGHVFQGRYKAILVEKDSYLLELCRYIVLNPVRAAMVRSAVEWPWSSYRATAGYERDLKALDVDWILAAFAERRDRAVESYEQFVADGKNQPSPWESLKNQVYLGSDQFVDDMQRRIEGAERLSEIPMNQHRPLAKPLQFYVDSASSRNEAIRLAYASGGYGLKDIGDFFGLHYSRVSRIIREAKRKT